MRGDADVIAVARHIERIERLHRRLGLAIGGAERGEIVLADEVLRGVVHRVGIERTRDAPGTADLDARDRRGD